MIDTIRPWTREDADALWPQLVDYLTVGIERGGDMPPTSGNVNYLLDLGCGWSRAGEPTRLAIVEGAVAGWVLWGSFLTALDQSMRTCTALASYTAPQFRSQGIASALRDTARDHAWEMGYERIVGIVQTANAKGITHFLGKGAVQTAVHLELRRT